MKSKLSIHVGARTFKTALAVFLCMLISWAIPGMDGINSCISTIICMMPTTMETLKVGMNRILATILACSAGMAVLFFYTFTPDYYYLARVILIPVFVIVLIIFCNAIHRPEAILLCTTVFIVLALGPQMSLPKAVSYSVFRFIETVIGIGVAFFVNGFIHPKRNEDKIIDLKKRRAF